MLLKNCNVMPMRGQIILRGYDIRIEGETITSVAPGLAPLKDEKVLDMSGKYVLPGFADMHVHITNDKLLLLLLLKGVTTARIMHGEKEYLEMGRLEAEGKLESPRIYCGTPIIDGSKGEIEWMMGLGDGYACNTPEQARQVVENCKKDGYAFIKNYPDIPHDAAIALLDIAYEEGIDVMGHNFNTLTPQEHIDHHYYCLEHVSRMFPDLTDVENCAKSGMWYDPTTMNIETLIDVTTRNKTDLRPEGMEYIDYTDSWPEEYVRYRNTPRFFNLRTEDFVAKYKAFAKYSDKLLVGTDIPEPNNVAGFSFHNEMKYLVEICGATPWEVLRYATLNAAKCLHIADKAGTVEAGKFADLVVLNSNPAEDINNTSDIFAVIKRGDLWNSERLQQGYDYLLEACKGKEVKRIFRKEEN